MNNYTKGEWGIWKHHGCTFVGTENTDGIKTTVATIEEAYPKGKGQKANAQLIASAPDLYEALRELRDWLKSDEVQIRGKGLCEYFGISDTMERVDKVLARVEVK